MRLLTAAEISECSRLGISVSSTHLYSDTQIALIMDINVQTAADPVYMIYLQAHEIPEYGYNYATFLSDVDTGLYTIDDVLQDIENFNDEAAFTPAPVTAGVVDPPSPGVPGVPGVDIVTKGVSTTIVVVLAVVVAFIIFVSSIGRKRK